MFRIKEFYEWTIKSSFVYINNNSGLLTELYYAINNNNTTLSKKIMMNYFEINELIFRYSI